VHWISEISLTGSRLSSTSFLTSLRLSDLSCVFALDLAASRSLPRTPSAETRDLWPAITMNATARGDFGWLSAVEHNGISELLVIEPVFHMEFRTKLGQRRWIEPTVCFFKSHTTLVIENCHRTLRFRFLRMDFPSFDSYFQDAPTGAGQGDRVSSKCLLCHLAGALLDEAWKEGNVIKRGECPVDL
jgi:hypothetical protein